LRHTRIFIVHLALIWNAKIAGWSPDAIAGNLTFLVRGCPTTELPTADYADELGWEMQSHRRLCLIRVHCATGKIGKSCITVSCVLKLFAIANRRAR
jgi:hypothetical protein